MLLTMLIEINEEVLLRLELEGELLCVHESERPLL